MAEEEKLDLGSDPSLLLVDDDVPFLSRLARAMEKRGFKPVTAETVAAGKAIAQSDAPAYAVIDLRLEDGNGLDVVELLRQRRPDARIVVLTGYGAIATAVAAVKMGAGCVAALDRHQPAFVRQEPACGRPLPSPNFPRPPPKIHPITGE